MSERNPATKCPKCGGETGLAFDLSETVEYIYWWRDAESGVTDHSKALSGPKNIRCLDCKAGFRPSTIRKMGVDL